MGIFSNKIIGCALMAWFAAQALKVLIDLLLKRKLNIGRMIGSGGMPSSHSAMVTALAVAVGRTEGAASVLFAICAVLAAIVMYDAAGVRRETGEQAKIINQMVENWIDDDTDFGRELKELVGHTPLEVFAGAALGIAIGFIMF
ncbi:MAG: divergent PAP2 family protein [Clostridia bacterium]|nr:divergent PAP2 family protein [Clostridia bacterium]MBR2972717.1 divergent PAP2 family protein [Clostridia bacterium]